MMNFLCINDILTKNGYPLFLKDKTYKSLFMDNESIIITICLNNEISDDCKTYSEYSIDWINQNFIKI